MNRTSRKRSVSGTGVGHHIDLSFCRKPAVHPITAATNAAPIVVTSARHGLATGDEILVGGVRGNNAANGRFNVTRVDENNFSLRGSVGDGDYARGGEWVLLLKAGVGAAATITKLAPRSGGYDTVVVATVTPASGEEIYQVDLYTDDGGNPGTMVGALYDIGNNVWDAYEYELADPHPVNTAKYHLVVWARADVFSSQDGTVPIP